mgnify:FL=1
MIESKKTYNKEGIRDMEKKKKILIVTAFPTHGAGSGALITTQAKSYVEEGHQVVIITGNNRTDFDKLEGVRYHVVPFTAETENPEKIENQCKFNYLMFTTHTESTANFWNASLEQIEEYMQAFEKAIREEINQFNPDIVHTQHNWITSSILSKFDKPVALTIHGTDLMGYQRANEELKKVNAQIDKLKNDAQTNDNTQLINNIKKLEEIYLQYKNKKQILADIKKAMDNNEIRTNKEDLEQLVGLYDDKTKYQLYMRYAEKSAQISNRIIVISEDQKKEFSRLFPQDKDRVVLLENGYDPKTFYMDRNVDRDEVLPAEQADYDNMVLFVGKFADFKGIDALLNATKIYEEEMSSKNKKIETLIVGSGVLDEKLRKQADELGLKNTHFLGRKNHTEIRQLQNLATVSLIPSRNEPFGLVVIEGTACGHPVIATNAGGIPGILNRENADISDKTKSYVTPLGILVPPLPDRPVSLDEAQKDELDEYMVKYMNASEEEKVKVSNEIANKLGLEIEDVNNYIESYMRTIYGISDGIKSIVLEQTKFDNQKIAKDTETNYSQDVIRDKILGIFEDAINDKKKINER